MRERVEEFLAELRLRMHPGKSRIYRTRDGVTFLGWRIFPDRTRLVRGNVVRFRRRLRAMQRAYGTGEAKWEDIQPRVQAWNAHAAHGDTWRLRESVFERSSFQRRSAV